MWFCPLLHSPNDTLCHDVRGSDGASHSLCPITWTSRPENCKCQMSLTVYKIASDAFFHSDRKVPRVVLTVQGDVSKEFTSKVLEDICILGLTLSCYPETLSLAYEGTWTSLV